jgi:mannan endo-1,4-beta-mannosidase
MLSVVIRWSGLAGLTLLLAGCGLVPGPLRQFVRRDGDRLMEGNREFRFISFNIPNLHFVEDDMRFDQRMPFRLPDDYEIDDALATIEQMGGQVVRMYALPVKRAGDPADVPRYILGPGEFNEEAFVVLDRVLASARRHRVRVILPFVDKWSWWGGKKELAAWRGKQPEDCWTDPQLIEDYEHIIEFVVNRRNTVTGIHYREDPIILGWETGPPPGPAGSRPGLRVSTTTTWSSTARPTTLSRKTA